MFLRVENSGELCAANAPVSNCRYPTGVSVAGVETVGRPGFASGVLLADCCPAQSVVSRIVIIAMRTTVAVYQSKIRGLEARPDIQIQTSLLIVSLTTAEWWRMLLITTAICAVIAVLLRGMMYRMVGRNRSTLQRYLRVADIALSKKIFGWDKMGRTDERGPSRFRCQATRLRDSTIP
jgi:hypothetical protein